MLKKLRRVGSFIVSKQETSLITASSTVAGHGSTSSN